MERTKEFDKFDSIPDLKYKYQSMGELATALIALDVSLTKTQSQVRRVIRRLDADW
jgi:hypothetical protein